MNSVAFIARTQFRRRIVSLAVVAVVLGLIGGVSISLIAGSRRSASVVNRYLGATRHYDMTVFAPPLTQAQVQAIPGVRVADPDAYVGLVVRAPDGTPAGGINGLAFSPSAIDPTFNVLHGRALRPDDDPANVMVNEEFTKDFRLGVGDTIPAQAFAEAQRDDVSAGTYQPRGPNFDFHVVGVVRMPPDIAVSETHAVGLASAGTNNLMIIPAAWYEANRKKILDFGQGFDVALHRPTDRDAVIAEITAAAKAAGATPDNPPRFGPARFSELRPSFETPVGLETTVLLVLGIAVAVAGTIAVALMLRAEQRAHASDDPTLIGLGATRNDLGLVGALRSAPVAVAGAAIAVLVAYLLSGRYPVGVGAELELDPGMQANVAVLVLSASAIVVLVLAIGFVLGRTHGRRATAPARGTLAGWFGRAGAPADATVGAHLAFDRAGSSSAVPTRPAIIGGAIALAVIAGVGVFVSGLDDVYARPAAHGFAWDIAVGNSNFAMTDAVQAKLLHDPRFAATEAGHFGAAKVNGKDADILAFDPHGNAPPTVLSGRLPRTPNEIALGERTMRTLDAHIGSSVRLGLVGTDFATDDTKDVDVKVVGTVLGPTIGQSDLGEISAVTLDAIKAAGGNASPQYVFARYRSSHAAATTAAIRRDYTTEMQTDIIPARAITLHRVRVLPLLGVLLAGLLGTVLLVYVLAIAVRVRTKEFGILRALGMSTRRVRRVLSWEGVIISIAMAAIGLPVGLLVGAFAWRALVPAWLGVNDTPVVSPWTLVLIPAVLVVGLTATIVPGRRLRRADVAALLHVE